MKRMQQAAKLLMERRYLWTMEDEERGKEED